MAPPDDPSVWAEGLWWLFLQRHMWGLLRFTATTQNIFCLELSKDTSSETLWHSRRYERAISQATWQAEIALNSLNPLKLQGVHSQQSILELQSLMGGPASSNRRTSWFQTREFILRGFVRAGPKDTWRRWLGAHGRGAGALLHVIIDKVLCFPAALKNAKVHSICVGFFEKFGGY